MSDRIQGSIFLRVSRIASLSVIFTGLLVLTGWIFDIQVLKSVAPAWVTMKLNTAAGFVLLGASLFLLNQSSESASARRLSQVFGAAAALVGLLTISEYVFGWDLGIDQLLFKDVIGAPGTSSPGRMSPLTALNFVLLGTAAVLVSFEAGVGAARAFTFLAALNAGLAALGYLYGIESFYTIAPYTQVALHTAVLFLASAAALFLVSQPERATTLLTNAGPAGVLIRRLLPAAIAIPIITGWLRLWGQRQGWYGTEFGLALVTAVNVIVIGTIIWWNASSIHMEDEKRRRAESRFLATFDQAAVGITHVAPELQWLRVNQKFCDIVGYSREELMLKKFPYITHPDDVATDFRYIGEMLAGTRGTYSLEKRYFRKDQSMIWVNLTVSLVRDASGSPDYFITVIEDISVRKQMEETLRTAEARLASLSEANLIGIVIADLHGGILDANPAFLRMVGYSREDALSGRLSWSEITPPEYREADERALEQLKSRGETVPWEKEYVRRDGSRVPVLVGVSLIRGTADRCIAFVLDLTERRRLEDQLRQAQRMEVIGRLAGGIAHDFNNLLTPIIGYSEMVLERMAREDPSYREVDEIRKAGRRASDLTRQLLAFSRKQILQPRTIDLNSLITEAANLIRRLIGEDVKLVLHLAPDLRSVSVDPGQMEQVLMNLAINARDAMPRGGTLTIETSNAFLDAQYAVIRREVVPGPYVLLTASDTGTGMDNETLAHLFEPFFTTKPKGKGTGLGLAMVHGIVNQSHGHIWVYSELGRGTTFKIYFPESKEKPASVISAAPAPAVTRGSETILLVEDNELLRNFAADVLRSNGYTVLEASDGESALFLNKAHAGSIDLLITDVVMPGMSGREVARQVLKNRPALRALYISGYTDNAIAHHGILDAGTELLEKPFTPDGLARKVRAMLDRA